MIEIKELENRKELRERFFLKIYDSCPHAYFDGIMGKGYVDQEDATSMIIWLGSYLYLDSKKNAIKEKMRVFLETVFTILPEHENYHIVPFSKEWEQILKEDELPQKVRYAMNPKGNFEKSELQNRSNQLPKQYQIIALNQEWYEKVKEEEWSYDFSGNYANFEEFSKYGFGLLVLDQDTLVAGASTYSTSKTEAEITIATSKDYRNQGISTAVTAKFMIECLKRNLIPSWDAANLTSVHIAKKLGYELDSEYVCYMKER